MEEYKIIIAGLVGSIITLILKWITELITESKRNKRELRKMVFQRKTDTVEKAMGWYQEAIDCWSMMQLACDEINEKYNSAVWAKFISSATKANKLYSESSSRLNPLYLYYTFTDIEQKYNASKSQQYINDILTKIGKYDEEARNVRLAGATDESTEIKELQNQAIILFKELSKAIDNQIYVIVDIQNRLRDEYRSYVK